MSLQKVMGSVCCCIRVDNSVGAPFGVPLIYVILLRFRTFLFALRADIQSAFLQISINENDRDYLRFLWFDDFLWFSTVFADKLTIV